MPFCPDCGTKVSEETQFCPECGRPLAIGQAVKGKSKKKLTGIIVACIVAIIVIIVLFSIKPWERTYTLSVGVNPSQAGFVSPSGGEYESGAQVTLIANPASGYTFDHWSGSASGTTSTTTITVDSDMTLTAHFKTIPTVPEVLFSDDFSDESSGWVTYDDYDGRVIYSDGCLYIKDYTYPEGTMYGESQRYFTDFILEVETWLVGGTDDNWHSVICRLQDEDNQYSFDISADGYYAITKWIGEGQLPLTGPTPIYSTYIHQGQGVTNLIHIECIGSKLSLSVNGHLLATVTDTTFTGGDICLAANALAGTFTEVAYDNFVVSEPSETIPTVPEVLFSDDFSDEAGVWDTFSDENGSVFYQNGWLHLINYTTATTDTGTYAHQHFTDFILEVETTLVGGTDENWHSVACRLKDGYNYYGFAISAEGDYLISRFIGGDQVLLAGPTYSTHIKQGQDVINLIRIECIGSNLNLSVNGHLLEEVIDATFTGGDVALVSTSWGGSFTEIAFDNIVVSEP
ncbi:MAG: zinc ribbon domain-containing protein [Dehalococcoidia bacterium]|nr:zinc ribbon domain-containing protein [Dehalococcoidia bacterium]